MLTAAKMRSKAGRYFTTPNQRLKEKGWDALSSSLGVEVGRTRDFVEGAICVDDPLND